MLQLLCLSCFPCLSFFVWLLRHRLYHCVASASFCGWLLGSALLCLLSFVQAMAYEALRNDCLVSDDEVAWAERCVYVEWTKLHRREMSKYTYDFTILTFILQSCCDVMNCNTCKPLSYFNSAKSFIVTLFSRVQQRCAKLRHDRGFRNTRRR